MTVKEQKKISFVNECGCIVDEEDLAKAILWYQKHPTLSKKENIHAWILSCCQYWKYKNTRL